MKEAAIILISYLLGSISFAYIFAKLFKGIDIRKYGTKNAGTSNVFLVVGKTAGILTLIGDLAKGAAAVLIAIYFAMPEYIVILAGTAAILGHIYPIFLQFRGGKGTATFLGMMIPLVPIELLISLGILILLSLITKRLLLAQLISLTIIPFLAGYFYNRSLTIVIGISLIILSGWIIGIYVHKKNLISTKHYYKLMKKLSLNL